MYIRINKFPDNKALKLFNNEIGYFRNVLKFEQVASNFRVNGKPSMWLYRRISQVKQVKASQVKLILKDYRREGVRDYHREDID